MTQEQGMQNGCPQRAGRLSSEVAWAALWPPLVATLAFWLAGILWPDAEQSSPGEGSVLPPLLLGGMAVLSALIYMDCRAKALFRSDAERVCVTQGIMTAIVMILLVVVAMAQAGNEPSGDVAPLVLFLGLPVLAVCGGCLWHAATLIQSSFWRGWLLVGFVIATAIVQLLSVRPVGRDPEERWFMLNSLLVALAFGVDLAIWSARQLNRTSERPSHG